MAILENKLPADFIDNEIRGEIALVNLKIGEIYYELNKRQEAVKSLEKSVALIKEIQQTDKLRFIQSRTLEESENLLSKN